MEIKIHPALGVAVRADGAIYVGNNGNRWKPHWSYGYKRPDGYRRVRIRGASYAVHRLVAETFIPNPEGKPTVDHADRDRSNNTVDNLRWATLHEQNMNCSTHLNTPILISQCTDPNGYKRVYYALNREKRREYQRNYYAKKKEATQCAQV